MIIESACQNAGDENKGYQTTSAPKQQSETQSDGQITGWGAFPRLRDRGRLVQNNKQRSKAYPEGSLLEQGAVSWRINEQFCEILRRSEIHPALFLRRCCPTPIWR